MRTELRLEISKPRSQHFNALQRLHPLVGGVALCGHFLLNPFLDDLEVS
eukprot:CAMPEP_0173104964 /NCGR_PEP_ID=MMETSP1102-20130122/39694_1 /TAXON_ID=49646 /ORGANISM="Geminigera sp., Strain Caron Lab Isolate" /LENGTH=48 /DNA_ID= /DNA_START= /DNA_END= /DNA_ORIENTATION=